MSKRRLWLVVAGIVAGVVTAGADFQRFDDFEDEFIGPVAGQDDWVATGGDNRVVVDPADPENQVLYVPSESSIVRKTLLGEGLAVPDGTIRMFFLRIRVSNKQTFSVGLSALTYPDEFSDFAPEIGMANSAQNLDLRAWDDDGGNYEILTQLLPDRWYNLWVRIDTYANTYELWLHDIAGTAATPIDQLAAADTDTLFQFRSGQASDLATFYIKTAGGSSGANFGPVYFDDIYLETTNALNLQHPTTALANLPGDVNADRCVNLLDYAVLAAHWQQGPAPPTPLEQGDLNNDDRVDESDLTLLAAHWLENCTLPGLAALAPMAR